MRSLILGFLLTVLFAPVISLAEVTNIGFVQGLWYSSEPVFVGVPTRVYVAFRNNTPHDLTGTIRFNDNDKRIGSSDVSVLSGRILEAWVDWTPTSGEHKISVTLADAKLHPLGENPESLDVIGIVTEDTLVIDTDTDGDKIGDKEDTDDDNDDVSDAEEKTRGTNPLVKNPKAETEDAEDEDAEATPTPKEVRVETTPATRDGLETYLPDGTVASLTENVTDTITDAKKSIDEYRDKRNEELYKEQATSSTLAESEESDSGNATITRSRIEPKQGIVQSLISGVKLIFGHIYTFILWILSGAFARPAFIELLFLLGILYFIYRFARRVGRRPNW